MFVGSVCELSRKFVPAIVSTPFGTAICLGASPALPLKLCRRHGQHPG